ncbi:unnamed protein product, partial [marine sediment metagenome]
HIQSKRNNSVALRIVRQGRIGYATTTQLGDSQNLVNNAVETAQFGMTARFELPSLTAYPRVEAYDPDVESVSLEKMIELGEKLVTTVKGHTPDIICEAGVTKGVVSVRIINSRGGQANYRKSIFSLGIEGTLIHDTDMLFVGNAESKLAAVEPVVDTVPAKVDKNPVAMPLTEKKQLLDEYNDVIWHTPKLQTSIISYGDSHKKVIFLSSSGSHIEQERTDITLRLTAVATKGNEVQQTGLSLGSSGDFSLIQGLHQRVEQMAQHAVELLSAPQVKG